MIEKYRKLPNSLKASLWFMICSMLQKGITFLTVPIFTRLLDTQQYGTYSLFLSWQEIISIFATLNLNYQVFNNGMIKYKKDKDGYATSMLGLALVSSLITMVVLFIFYKIWYELTGIDYRFIILMIINMYSLLVIGIWTVRRRYEYSYKDVTIITIIMSLLNPILGVIFVNLGTEKVLLRIASIVITSLLFAIITFAFLYKKNKKIINLDYWKYALKLDLPLIPHYISMVLLHSSDRIMIGYLINKSATAFYSVSYNVALVMQIVLNAINASFIPWVYQQLDQKNYSHIKKYSTLLIIFVAIISVIPMFFAPEAVYILGGREYMDAVSIIPILSTSVFMIFFYSIFIIVEMYYEKPTYITVGSVMAAVVNLVLNYIFISKYGYKAAAYTTLFSYMILAVFHYLMYKKVCKNKKIFVDIFDSKSMIVIATVLIAISIVITFTYKYILIRYISVLFIAIVFIVKRNSIINTYKMFKNKKNIRKEN